MPDRLKLESKLLDGEASGRYAIRALVVIVLLFCGTPIILALLQ